MKPQKLFISYPSESWNFAQRIAENLAPRLEQSLFIDYRSIDQVDFAESILSHLRDSDAVLLMVTDFTFADIHRDNDWLRLEIRTALEEGIPIVLVRENGKLPPNDLPDDVRAVNRSQGVPFYREFFTPGIDMLCEFLIRIGVGTARTSGKAKPVIQPTPPPAASPADPAPQRTIGGQGSIEEAMDLLDAGDYEKADFLLRALDRGTLRKLARKTVDDLLAYAGTMRQAAERRRGAAQDYELIAAKAKRKLTEAAALQEFAAWAAEFPDLVEALDSENLRQRTPPPPARPALLPAPFEWIEIPGKGYSIAKYPVTNAQFQVFIDAPDGYSNAAWWDYSEDAKNWRANNSLQNTGFNGADHPRTNVCWYEAVAFCRWLSAALTPNPSPSGRGAATIMLPTEEQWQYAAQGDDNREYPWGDAWDCQRCNNSVSPCKSKSTTPVTHYAGKGDSPFGVVDMAGNVREWCLTDYDSGDNNISATATYRVLRGGSWFFKSDFFRCALRGWINPHGGYGSRGFRLALS